jgi:glutamine synthetase
VPRPTPSCRYTTHDRCELIPPSAEYEFYQFRAPQTHDGPERNSSATASFLRNNPVNALPSLTEGMFGYSITRTVHNQDYFYGIFDACEKFNCGIEGWHTESGPGVFEAVPLPLIRYPFPPC